MRGPHPRLIRLAAARGAYLCLKSFGDRAPCPSAAKSGRTPWDSPRSHIDTVACCSPCRSALAASASTPSTPSVAGGTRLALQKACDVGRRWRGRAQRRWSGSRGAALLHTHMRASRRLAASCCSVALSRSVEEPSCCHHRRCHRRRCRCRSPPWPPPRLRRAYAAAGSQASREHS